jgi:23S rRNA pseudouridine1911/1915/1917 synthase
MKKTKSVTQKNEFRFKIENNAELMPFLIEKFPSKNRDNIKSLLRNKLVLVNGITQTHFKYNLVVGDLVIIGKKEIKQATIPGLKIVFEDPSIIVVEKPAGLLTISSEKEKNKTLFHYLSTYVKKEDPKNKVFIVHRLDRETSGLLVFAKNEQAKYNLQKNWNDVVKERTYIALVEGKVEKQEDTLVSYLKESKALKVHASKNESYGQKAITNYKVIEQFKNTTKVELNLETGRKNQIRVQMEEISHPILGDKKYGSKVPFDGRIALHASSLSFIHPVTKKIVKFTSKVPF